MIKAVIVDCFGVLTATDHWHKYLATLNEEQAEEARYLNHQRDKGQISAKEFQQLTLEKFGASPESVEDMPVSLVAKNTELLLYLKMLKNEYKIGLISNISSNWIRDTFLTPEEQAVFDDMVLSFEVGTTKPDRRIFEIACNNLGINTDEFIFVDDVKDYCQVAEALGAKSVWYRDFLQTRSEIEAILSTV